MKGRAFTTGSASILLALALTLTSLLSSHVAAAGPYPYASSSDEVSTALDYLRSQQDTDGKIADFATSAWAVMAIVAAGEDPASWRVSSNPSVVEYLSAHAANASAANDYSRMLLAIAAAGEDPTDFGGSDFVALLEAEYDGTQIGDEYLLNDDFWAVMALVAAGRNPL
ncbi:MAG: hypothetical protein JXA58_04240, partial [Dehalococcoidia bacterium]|nr:hypothetical protein [Dehalococcoidia bacterium]